MSDFDDIAADYDATRGGEPRGDEYAADLDARLPRGDGPILEIGVGTGVVALGLRRRGRAVIGLDISAPMLARALPRLGPVLLRCDAASMALPSASVAHAVSVWVVHALSDPGAMFAEAARVIRPAGRYVLCSGQHPALDDRVGVVIAEMAAEVDRRRGADRPRGVTVDEVAAWAEAAGFDVAVERLVREWRGSPDREIDAIERRAWPAMRDLDDDALEAATRPTLEALAAMPAGEVARRGFADLLVLTRP
jgi:ubiquinone/menaquinone biosynthesis C-methylase UbiE